MSERHFSQSDAVRAATALRNYALFLACADVDSAFCSLPVVSHFQCNDLRQVVYARDVKVLLGIVSRVTGRTSGYRGMSCKIQNKQQSEIG